MRNRYPSILTAGLVSLLLAAGPFATTLAGEGCDKGKKKGESTSTLWCPATIPLDQGVDYSPVRP